MTTKLHISLEEAAQDNATEEAEKEVRSDPGTKMVSNSATETGIEYCT